MACQSYDLLISSIDTSQATGNTSFSDFVVYINYVDCSGNPNTIQLPAGSYPDQICADLGLGPIDLLFYQNDSPSLPSFSTYSVGSGSCAGPTPTTTPTPTATEFSGTVIYVVSAYTQNSFVSPSCPAYNDTEATYDFTLYDEGGNITTLPFNLVVPLTVSPVTVSIVAVKGVPEF